MAAGKSAPDFWFELGSWKAALLTPAAMVYSAIASRQMVRAKPQDVDAPVLCVGNFTVGGTGKTPTSLALIEAAKQAQLTPGVVLRGYGGKKRKAHLVDPNTDASTDVGDEALLFAQFAPTVTGTDRARSARALIDAGCNFIIMDDGFQSRRLHYDYAVITVDARRGFGNGRILPAGPLRAPVATQLPYADLMLLIGEGDAADRALRQSAKAGKPIARASMVPVKAKTLLRKKLIAFSGIGDPQKFFDTLRQHGAELVHVQPFPDHHEFSELDASGLLDAAQRKKLTLVTTEKDMARLKGRGGKREQLAESAAVLRVELSFADANAPSAIIQETLAKYRSRRLTGRTAKN